MADVVTPILAAGTNVAQSFLNYNAQKEANELNIRLARERNAQQVALMREQNKFNSPDTQAALMQYAGINPSGVQQGSASSTPDLATPQVTPPQLDMQAMQLALQGAQIAKTNAETENISEDSKVKQTQSDLNRGLISLNDFDLKIKALDFDFADKSFKPRLEMLNQQLEDFKQNVNKKKAEIDTILYNLKLTKKFQPKIFASQLNDLVASAKDKYSSAAYRDLQKQFLPKLMNAQIANYYAENKLYSAQSHLATSQYNAQKLQNGLSALNWRFQYYDFLASVGVNLDKVSINIAPYGSKSQLYKPSKDSFLRQSAEYKKSSQWFENYTFELNKSLDVSQKIMGVIGSAFGCFRDAGIGSSMLQRPQGVTNNLITPPNIIGGQQYDPIFHTFK